MALYEPHTELKGAEAEAFLKRIENPSFNPQAAQFRAYAEKMFGSCE